MRTIHITHTDTNTSNNLNHTWKEMMDTYIKPLFDSFNNLTYIGYAESGNHMEYIYQIYNYENIYLRITKGNTSISAQPSIAFKLSTSNSTSVTNNFLPGTNVPEPLNHLTFWNVSSGPFTVDFYLYLITDENNNLKVVWTPLGSYGSQRESWPFIITKTEKNNDIIIRSSSSELTPYNVTYLGDSNNVPYYIQQDATSYTSTTDVLKSSCIPVVTNGSWGSNNYNAVDVVNSEIVHIYNTRLGAYFTNNDNYNNNSANVRLLIQSGGKLYRQMLNNWWIEDPKGNEQEEFNPIITNN